VKQPRPFSRRALEEPAHRRGAFLAEACAGDQQLSSEVEALLAGHDFDGGIVDRPVASVVVSILEIPAPGEVIGPYRLLHEIAFVRGESGIGKTTLVESFLSRVRGRTRIAIGQGQCLDQRGSGEDYMQRLACSGPLSRPPQ
jgi:predicted ATPase